MATAIRCARYARMLAVLLLSFVPALALQAAEQRYDYDPLGRLIRSVEDTQANEYIYDPAGNLLQVTGGAVQPPSITSGDLGDFRRNAYRQVAVSGQNLSGANIRPSHNGLRIDNVIASATAISFRVGVAPDTPLGTHQLFFETAAGSANVGLNVVPGLSIVLEPLPITVPPDSQARKYTVRMAEPATEDQTFSLSTSAPAIAKTKTSAVSILAGQTTADIGVIGVATGSTTLRLSSASLVEPLDTLVSVAAGAGSQLVNSRPLGITRGVPWALPSQSYTFSKAVGIVRTAPWAIEPENDLYSATLGISRSAPFADNNSALVVSPPVGITKP